MNDLEKIIRMNAFIQRKQGTLYLDGKEIVCVSLDRTYATFEKEITEPLTDAQLDDLLGQIYGKPPATQPREEDENGLAVGDLVSITADGLIESISSSGYMVRVHGEIIPMGKEFVKRVGGR
ncbi:MAG: hypothetical protein ACJ788_24410 [Ktedonobacteraceae bacterium]